MFTVKGLSKYKCVISLSKLLCREESTLTVIYNESDSI